MRWKGATFDAFVNRVPPPLNYPMLLTAITKQSIVAKVRVC